jgi:O-antigen/teichoic acid export membrane protein
MLKSILYNHKFKNLSLYLFTSGISAIIGLFINPFLSIGLSHSDFATIGYYSAISMILAPIINFSLQAFYSKSYFLLKKEQRKDLLNTLLSLHLLFGFFIFLFFIVGYYYYHESKILSIPFTPYALLSFIPIYFGSFYNMYLLELRMKDNALMYTVVSLTNVVLAGFLSVFLVFILKYGAEGRLFALMIVSILFGSYSLLTQKFTFKINWTIAKQVLTFCSPLVISALLTFFFMGIDRIFLNELEDTRTLGLYNIGLQISGYLGIFGTVFLQTFEPDLYKYASLGNNIKVIKLVLSIFLITVIPNVLFIFISKPLIYFLTYGKYTDSADFANILCLRNIATIFSFSLSTVVVAYGFSRFELVNKILGALFSILAYKFLINNYGFYGAAWGQSLSWFIMAMITVTFLFLKRFKFILKQ